MPKTVVLKTSAVEEERRDCRDPGTATLIVRYFLNDLTKTDRRELEAHLDRCPCCTERLRALDEVYSANPKDRGER